MKLIKTVKGKEYEMDADESQAVLLLKDKRYRPAETVDKKIDLDDEAVKARIDDMVSRGFSREHAVSMIEEELK